ncbi:MAG: phosphopantothenoylcysteine decarboxylase [Culicoidibacterales bacterium]
MNILITAGGTSEPIDAVRSIKNEATGQLGMLIAEQLVKVSNQVEVYYIHDTKAYVPMHERVHPITIQTVSDLEITMRKIIQTREIDMVIHSMAVSDYKTHKVLTDETLAEIFTNWNQNETRQMEYRDFQQLLSEQQDVKQKKMSSKHQTMFVSLMKTTKVIEQIKKWNANIKLIGFKLLQDVSKEALIDVAYAQLIKNDELFVVANDKCDITPTEHHAYIIDKDKHYIECKTKQEIAEQLVELLNIR